MQAIGWMLAFALSGCWSGAPESEPAAYTVVAGDTLFVIARDHGVSLDALRAANAIDGDLIEVGQRLVIPRRGAAVAPNRARSAPTPRGRPQRASAAEDARLTLRLPSEKPCLAGPTGDALGERGAVASQGLSQSAVKAALDGFASNLLRCATPGSAGLVTFTVVVACTGRVASVRAGPTGADADVVACMADTLRYAPFPAHDLPDGETIDYPLSWQMPD